MKPEFANRITDRTIVPPTQVEFQEAARRGRVLTSEVLREIRSDARGGKRSAVTRPTVAVTPSSADATLITKLQAKITKLRGDLVSLKNENARLLVANMGIN